jgi:tetratricopeptide (TPR) repeat protein
LSQAPKVTKYQNEIINFYQKMTKVKMLSGNYPHGMEYCRLGLDHLISTVGPHSHEVASLKASLAEILMRLQRHSEAKVIYEESLQIYQTLHPDLVHVEVPSLLYSLYLCATQIANTSTVSGSGGGGLDQNEDEGRNAEMTRQTEHSYLHLSLEIIEKLFETTITSVDCTSKTIKLKEMKAICLRELSLLLVDSDSRHQKAQEAIDSAQQAHQLIHQIYGINSHEAALALCHIGKIYKKLIKYSEAAKLFHEVIMISEKCLRNDAAIEALNHLADINFAQSKYIETEQYLNKALAYLRQRQYLYDDQEAGSSLSSFENQFQSGHMLLSPQSEMRMSSQQEGNSLIAQQLCTLGDLKRETNEYEKSRQYYEGALLILKTTYGVQHTSVAQVLEMLSELFIERGEGRIGRRYHDEALGIYQTLQSGEHYSGFQEAEDTEEKTKSVVEAAGNSTTTLGGLAALISAEEKYDDIIPLPEKVV